MSLNYAFEIAVMNSVPYFSVSEYWTVDWLGFSLM